MALSNAKEVAQNLVMKGATVTPSKNYGENLIGYHAFFSEEIDLELISFLVSEGVQEDDIRSRIPPEKLEILKYAIQIGKTQRIARKNLVRETLKSVIPSRGRCVVAEYV